MAWCAPWGQFVIQDLSFYEIDPVFWLPNYQKLAACCNVARCYSIRKWNTGYCPHKRGHQLMLGMFWLNRWSFRLKPRKTRKYPPFRKKIIGPDLHEYHVIVILQYEGATSVRFSLSYTCTRNNSSLYHLLTVIFWHSRFSSGVLQHPMRLEWEIERQQEGSKGAHRSTHRIAHRNFRVAKWPRVKTENSLFCYVEDSSLSPQINRWRRFLCQK